MVDGNRVLFNNYDLGPREMFIKLDRLYENNGLYERYTKLIDPNNTNQKDHWEKILRPIMTCANRVSEFYVAKVGKNVKVKSDNQAVLDAITQFDKFSNWETQQDLAKRFLALHGNLFVKIVGMKNKVYREIIHAKYVTSLDVDNRGYLTQIRFDIELVDEEGSPTLYTEWWSKDLQSYAFWQSKQNTRATPLNELDGLIDSGPLSDFGIDFIPIVFTGFKFTGRYDNLADGSLNHVLDKLDYANALANRAIDNILRFNKPLTIVNGTDQDTSGQLNTPITTDLYEKDDYAVVNANDFDVKNIQSGVNYDANIRLAEFIKNEIEEDLPELRFYKIKESDSGASVRLTMAGAISKAESMQKSFLAAVNRMNEMAISLGQFYGLWSVGSYDAGDFEHEITADEVFPYTLNEKLLLLKEVGVQLDGETAMEILGFSEDIISKFTTRKQAEDQRKQDNLANAMSNFNSGV